jgi:hypothetical protein
VLWVGAGGERELLVELVDDEAIGGRGELVEGIGRVFGGGLRIGHRVEVVLDVVTFKGDYYNHQAFIP